MFLTVSVGVSARLPTLWFGYPAEQSRAAANSVALFCTMQTFVRQTYLKVIDATIEHARAEFAEAGEPDATIALLDTVKSRWRDRLLLNQDFTDEPRRRRRGIGSRRRRASKIKSGKAGPSSKRARKEGDEDCHGDERDSGDGTSSSDSDLKGIEHDPVVEDYVIATHAKASKSKDPKGGEKWKVTLKEGVAHINGRDYPFEGATCELQW